MAALALAFLFYQASEFIFQSTRMYRLPRFIVPLFLLLFSCYLYSAFFLQCCYPAIPPKCSCTFDKLSVCSGEAAHFVYYFVILYLDLWSCGHDMVYGGWNVSCENMSSAISIDSLALTRLLFDCRYWVPVKGPLADHGLNSSTYLIQLAYFVRNRYRLLLCRPVNAETHD
ncbi:hypothetical protein BT63DRAFT_281909 [Microthyrium microscopicum]|uniref:Uncharacterized protein n=1 Tax=Microthyrium microscopicum TaxID=703497 RepID=A0A6A6UBZ6_9PEZI|nr:hypothetical protein BT63DRAFT_281909 [Microthyrium microscopicum]